MLSLVNRPGASLLIDGTKPPGPSSSPLLSEGMMEGVSVRENFGHSPGRGACDVTAELTPRF
jgi:hypothetical protein